ncbi:hypothetical protein AT15_06275 [Kosmotoga arenicorallina S304]|uniref:Glycosyl transferase family 1 domain-containing protein n=1 Tax=Kosmotoga arenicorallina S304 TaxID=1453497 RepID=A0A176JTT1_9BACT|nr:hypothetical protein [Kosmotoga arenicorallina]OAA26749.1 hypothetical protein AT15_06275 [Kosmotoga arenicorallina S304]
MIVLFNLNSYLGGGEVLLVRLAEEFAKKDVEFCIVSSFDDGYINDEAKKYGFYVIRWPIPNDSVLYMTKNEKRKVIDFFAKKFHNNAKLEIFTFCFRDIYNAYVVFSNLNSIRATYSTGIFHPRDTHYLASYSLRKKRIIGINRKLLEIYVNYQSVSFMNEMNLQASLKNFDNSSYKIIPLPIPEHNEQSKKKAILSNRVIRIVWVGRFVDFKLSSIIMIIDFVRRNPGYHLTLIGYGPCEKRIRRYIRKNSVPNVDFAGKVHPDELDKKLLNYDIGYCMGTSILETAKLGIPTVIAAMLPKNYYKKNQGVCLGIFGKDSGFNLGELDIDDKSHLSSIDDCIKDIVENYAEYSSLTLSHVHRFEMGEITEEYLNLIKSSTLCLEKDSVVLPKPPIIKYVAKRIIYLVKGIKGGS